MTSTPAPKKPAPAPVSYDTPENDAAALTYLRDMERRQRTPQQ